MYVNPPINLYLKRDYTFTYLSFIVPKSQDTFVSIFSVYFSDENIQTLQTKLLWKIYRLFKKLFGQYRRYFP